MSATKFRKPAKTAAALDRAWSRWKGSFASFMARVDRDATPYLSHSKFSEFQRCPRCYYRRYVLGENEESAAMRLGSHFHKAAHMLYTAESQTTPRRLLASLNTRTLDSESLKKLHAAITLLCQNRWSDNHAAVSVEEPFFLDLAPDLPPVIGIADLILREGERHLVVDHKTSAKFNELSPDQLVLYAEHVRRSHGVRLVDGFYDEYRLVTNLATIRKPAFRRTPVAVGRNLLSSLIKRYRAAWKEIAVLDKTSEPASAYDCWKCNFSHHY